MGLEASLISFWKFVQIAKKKKTFKAVQNARLSNTAAKSAK
jgi:hypothetical protein